MLFIKALSVFLGTVIGVGIFGLPFVAFKAGFFIVFLYFLLMSLIVILIHSIYGEVILETEQNHRLPGYVGEYLGETWKKISFFVIAVGLIGALLAYLIVGSGFLFFFLAPYFGGSLTLYALIFFSLGAYLVFRGIKSISQVELLLLLVLLIILIIFSIRAFPLINLDYFKDLDLRFLTFPYGVVLFSLWGSAVVPEIKEMLTGSKLKPSKVRSHLKKVICWGIIFAVIIYLLFVFIVLGASGPITSKEAILGLDLAIGGNIIKLGFIFGVIACFTSFLALGLTLKKTLWYDFGLSKNLSWALTCFLPLILFLLGMREFIEIIGFIGAVSIGAEGIIIVFLYKGFLKKRFSKKMNPGFYLLTSIFILGVVLETIYLFVIRY